jgi:hypothetical protein
VFVIKSVSVTSVSDLYAILARESHSTGKNFVPATILSNLITVNIIKFKLPRFICKNLAERSV